MDLPSDFYSLIFRTIHFDIFMTYSMYEAKASLSEIEGENIRESFNYLQEALYDSLSFKVNFKS